MDLASRLVVVIAERDRDRQSHANAVPCPRHLLPISGALDMKNRLLVALLVLCLVMLACGSSVPKTADDYVKQYGGSLEVYQQILTSNDCAWLQKQFDQAYENSELFEAGSVQHKRATGFMTASNKQMEDIGCYK